jgi:hypothetical protein
MSHLLHMWLYRATTIIKIQKNLVPGSVLLHEINSQLKRREKLTSRIFSFIYSSCTSSRFCLTFYLLLHVCFITIKISLCGPLIINLSPQSVTSLTLDNWQFVLHLYNFVTLRMLYKWNHIMWPFEIGLFTFFARDPSKLSSVSIGFCFVLFSLLSNTPP